MDDFLSGFEATATADRGHLETELRMHRMPAVVDALLRRLMSQPNLDQLLIGWVSFTVMGAEAALTIMNLNHMNLSHGHLLHRDLRSLADGVMVCR
jgi:hypothetical protein